MGDSLSCLLFQSPPSSGVLRSGPELRAARSSGKEFLKSFTGTNQPIIWLYTKTGHRVPAVFANYNAEYTVIFSHGNAEDLSRISNWVTVFNRTAKVNTLAYDYPGYGLTKGGEAPKEEFCHAAAHAAYRYLVDIVGISPTKIVLYGRSLGGSVSAHLAQRLAKENCPPAGLILQSAPLSAFRVVLRVHGGCSLPGDRLDTGKTIVDVQCPTLVIHGDKDGMVPFWHGKELHNAVPKEYRVQPLWVQGAGHNDVEVVGMSTGVFQRRIRQFLDREVKKDLRQQTKQNGRRRNMRTGEREKKRSSRSSGESKKGGSAKTSDGV